MAVNKIIIHVLYQCHGNPHAILFCPHFFPVAERLFRNVIILNGHIWFLANPISLHPVYNLILLYRLIEIRKPCGEPKNTAS